MSRPLQTVTGTMEPQDVDGWVLPHEHLHIDLRTDTDAHGVVDDTAEVIAELRELRQETSLALVVDQTCRGMGRDVRRLREISEATDVAVIAGTGYYYDKFHPSGETSQDPESIAILLIEEIEIGIEGSGIRAGVLGEIGTSGPDMTKRERSSLKAAAMASLATGTPIATHAHLSTGAQQQLDLLVSEGVDPHMIVLGHQDLAKRAADLLPLLKQGVYLGFDTIGKNSYQPDSKRQEMLLELIEAGWESRILLSNDISRNPYLVNRGGHGYSHVMRSFVPGLRDAGVGDATIDKLIRTNSLSWLTGVGDAQ